MLCVCHPRGRGLYRAGALPRFYLGNIGLCVLEVSGKFYGLFSADHIIISGNVCLLLCKKVNEHYLIVMQQCVTENVICLYGFLLHFKSKSLMVLVAAQESAYPV